jgi:ubiquinone/menaquinone biosynthesis C-methylase UbiE
MNRPNEQNPGSQAQRVCPWWCCFTFDNFVRRWLQNPVHIVEPYVKPGDSALDVGPGMGYFTIPIARLVGEKGQVIAADLQPEMLAAIKRRAAKAGVLERVRLHQCQADNIGVKGPVDFALAFWMVHEVPDKPRVLSQIAEALKTSGLLLLVEPRIHVSTSAFQKTIEIAQKSGFHINLCPSIFFSHSVLCRKR